MNAIIVLNYNDYKTTKEFISRIKNYNVLDHIVIVDNCSTDNSFSELCNLKNDRIDVIKTERNDGYASGNNYGARFAIQKYNVKQLMISNSDIFIDEITIKSILNFLQLHNNAGAVTAKMNCLSGIYLPVAWKLPEYRNCIWESSMLIKKIRGDKTEYNNSFFNQEVSKVDVVPGSFFAISTSVFLDINGFDEDTFLYYEENILGYKLKQKNYQSYILNSVKYDHNHSVCIDKNIKSVTMRLRICNKSRKVYCKKYLKCNDIKIFILNIINNLGIIEYSVYNMVRKRIRN